jgi:hypothetical protein
MRHAKSTLGYAGPVRSDDIICERAGDGCVIFVPGFVDFSKTFLSQLASNVVLWAFMTIVFSALIRSLMTGVLGAATIAFAIGSMILDRYLHRHPPPTVIRLAGFTRDRNPYPAYPLGNAARRGVRGEIRVALAVPGCASADARDVRRSLAQ